MDTNVKEWKEHLLKLNFKGINLIADGWVENTVCKGYGLTGIPHYFIIDADGKMVDNNSPRLSQPELLFEIFDRLLKNNHVLSV